MSPLNHNLLNLAANLCLIAALSGTPSAHAQNESIEGRIHSRDSNRVQACFDRAVSISAGQEFDVVRHTVLTQPKVATTMKSERVGLIRIDSIGNDGCAEATLIRGAAQTLDWVASTAKP